MACHLKTDAHVVSHQPHALRRGAFVGWHDLRRPRAHELRQVASLLLTFNHAVLRVTHGVLRAWAVIRNPYPTRYGLYLFDKSLTIPVREILAAQQ